MKNFTFEINTALLSQVMIDKLHSIEKDIKTGLREFGINTEDDLNNLQYLIIFHTNDNFKDEVFINGKLTNAKELDSRLLVYGMALSCFYAAKFTLEHKPYSTFIESIFEAESFLFSLKYKLPFSSEAIEDIQRNHSSEIGKKGALAMLAKSEKQKAIVEVKRYWDRYQKDPYIYESQAAFARDMIDKFEILKSSASIERRCRKWRENLLS
ncbi:MAG: hypothetical protein HOO90_00950 [Methylotenera sp.]|uniref:hypothetical protein n=1 Tax=Methylotenera sp. TaxID=2051956 RepID=UPI00183A9CA9|nr:hypothetical protein [Methylotenera sp.]NOU24083.1 hypothetical protein [Methylotenera sp.]